MNFFTGADRTRINLPDLARFAVGLGIWILLAAWYVVGGWASPLISGFIGDLRRWRS